MYWLGDKHTRILIIAKKSWTSTVICSFQDFKHKKSVKTEILFC